MKIRAYIGYNESTHSHFYRAFDVVSVLPQVGDIEDGYDYIDKVVSVDDVQIDCEQGNYEAYYYNYYAITIKRTFLASDEHEEFVDYVCVDQRKLISYAFISEDDYINKRIPKYDYYSIELHSIPYMTI